MSVIKLGGANTFEEAFESFKAHCKAKNLSHDTIVTYEAHKRCMINFMGGDFELNQITKCLIQRFIEESQAHGNRVVSINSKLKHLRAMINYFADQGWMEKVHVQLLKQTQTIKETYSDAELDILLKKPNIKKCNFDDYRNWVLINFFLGTGCRLSSVVNIQIRDIDLQANDVVLRHTKNRSVQYIPIASALRSILIEYLHYRKAENDTDYLFCTWHGERFTKYGLRNALVRYNQRRGVTKTSIHLYRHTFAKKWIMNGGDVLRLQKLLGHKSLEMVKEYVALFGADLHKNFDDFNPLSSMAKKKSHIKMK